MHLFSDISYKLTGNPERKFFNSSRFENPSILQPIQRCLPRRALEGFFAIRQGQNDISLNKDDVNAYAGANLD